MGLEINAYQAAIRSLIGREKSDFDSEMLDTLTKLFDAADDIEIFATASIENGKSISDGEEKKEMLKIVEKMPINQLRVGGLVFSLIGFFLIWYFKR